MPIDPFKRSGTTINVALQYGRNEYWIKLMQHRTSPTGPRDKSSLRKPMSKSAMIGLRVSIRKRNSGRGWPLPATRSISEAMDAYHECLVKQMKMTVEDGQRLIVDYQKIVQIFARAWSSTWVTGKHVIGEW